MRSPRIIALAVVVVVATALPQTAAAAQAPSIYWGAYINGAPFNTSLIDAFESQAGKRVSIITWGQPWTSGGTYQVFQTAAFQVARSRGAIPMLTWGSWNLGSGTSQPNFQLDRIAAGAHDAYLIQWAKAAHAWGQPFFLRFDHEMNGWWYPWSEQLNGNGPGDYVRAWRHVHDIFVQQGATNATWVWCPNIVSPRSTPTSSVYPGDAYVDWSCMDGYNWGTDRNNAWQTFTQVFSGSPSYGGHNTYQELLATAPSKPIMIGETASSEHGGSKSAWITNMVSVLPTSFPRVQALIWFNYNDGDPTLTWPITSSAAAQTAFVQAIASPMFATNQYAGLTGGAVKALPLLSAGTTSGSVTVTPVADTYTSASAPSSTLPGTSLTLRADAAGTDTAFLRFDLSSLAGKTLTAAALRLHLSSEAWAGSAATFDVKLVASTDWKEQYMSFVNSVPISSVVLGSLVGASSPSTWYQVTLNATTLQSKAGGLVSAALVGRSGDVLIFQSRESGAATAPQLVVSYR
jgi:hypothetical protein